jgi:fructose-specific phosphotransferase system component IIB
MRWITFLLAVAACAGVVYNHLQWNDLRQRVEQIQVKLASQQNGSEPASITEAKRHLQRALQLMSAGKLDEAKKEMEQGSRAIAQAAHQNGDTQHALQQIQQMMDSARKELARFWSGKQEKTP